MRTIATVRVIRIITEHAHAFFKWLPPVATGRIHGNTLTRVRTYCVDATRLFGGAPELDEEGLMRLSNEGAFIEQEK